MPTPPTDTSRQRPAPIAAWVNAVMIPIALIEVGLVLTESASALRIWLAVAVFLFGAGSGLVQFLRIPEAPLQIGMLLALSVAADLLLSQSLLWAHDISGPAAVCVLAGLTCMRPLPRRSTRRAGDAS